MTKRRWGAPTVLQIVVEVLNMSGSKRSNPDVFIHRQVTIIFVVSVGLSVCLLVSLFVCAEFFSAVFDPISIKLGHMLYVWV